MNLSIFFSPKPSIVKHWKPLGLGYKPHQLPLQIEGVWALARRAAPRRKAEAVRSLGVPVGGGAAEGQSSCAGTRERFRAFRTEARPSSHLEDRITCTAEASARQFCRPLDSEETVYTRMSGFTAKQSLELWEQLSKWLLLHLNGTALSTPWLI